jgi:hypothetical protein
MRVILLGIILYHQKIAKENADEAQEQDIMVDGSCPNKFVSSSERMLRHNSHRAGRAIGINP